MSEQLPSLLGITGNGQLGDMVATQAARMHIKTLMWAPAAGPGFAHATSVLQGPFENRVLCANFANNLRRHNATAVTEFENVPCDIYASLQKRGVPMSLSAYALRIAQHRHLEKRLAVRCRVPAPDFVYLPGGFAETDIDKTRLAGKRLRLKANTQGYDGHGQWSVASFKEAVEKIEELKAEDAAKGLTVTRDFLLEAVVNFDYECSVLVARSPDGSLRVFPAIRNTHKDGILVTSEWRPGIITRNVERAARAYAKRMSAALGDTGLKAFEFFVAKDGTVLFNEFAPRIHNSGHLTMEAATMSQSEALIRSACGMPMPDCEVIQMTHAAIMHNLLGEEIEQIRTGSPPEGQFWHDYRKSESRPGRKMGHITKLVEPVGSYVHH